MLFDAAQANRYRCDRCRDHPRKRHRAEAQSKHPTEIVMFREIKRTRPADTDGDHINDAKDLVKDGRTPIQSKPQL